MSDHPPKVLPPMPLSDEQWRRLAYLMHLPPQEAKVVELILRGMSDKSIAASMRLKLPTIRTYLTRTFHRLSVTNRIELVLRLFAESERCHQK